MNAHLTPSEKSVSTVSTHAKPDLHVLTLTPFFPCADDEVSGCFIAESTRQLAQFGVSSTVIAVSPLYHRKRQPSPGAPAHWVRYPQIPGNLGLSSAGRWLFARLLSKVSRLHRQKPINVIHAHAALPCGHAAALLSERLKIPFLVTLHGLDVFNSSFLGGLPAAWRRKASMDVYRAAQTVICISRRVQNILGDGMASDARGVVVYNGTDTDFFLPALFDASHTNAEILVVGNLLFAKGHELVLRAIAKLTPSFPELRCRIIGEGSDRTRLEILVRELGIAQRVKFEGRKSRAEVANAMRTCTVFVLPSRCEGLGCVYLEAMACAKPVVACRGQGIEEIIEHEKNGWLIHDWIDPIDGASELAQGLSILFQSSDLRERMGASARKTIVDRLTLSHQAQRLAQLYAEAAK